jgi:hypothetical protein
MRKLPCGIDVSFEIDDSETDASTILIVSFKCSSTGGLRTCPPEKRFARWFIGLGQGDSKSNAPLLVLYRFFGNGHIILDGDGGKSPKARGESSGVPCRSEVGEEPNLHGLVNALTTASKTLLIGEFNLSPGES